MQPPRTRRRLRLRAAILTASLAAALTVPAALNAQALAAAAQTCATPSVLAGSDFEIDTVANLKVDGAGCIDWLEGGANTPFRSGVIVKPDRPSGSSDDSFGMGTKEDDANPTIVRGSIPPNKSDLLNFGVYSETTATAKFLELFWQRKNSPAGTTNMDFELNQKFCDVNATPTNCASNGAIETATPVRTPGDRLITYDLSRGGVSAAISIRTWTGSAWGPATVISGPGGQALGSVNGNPNGRPALPPIPASETGGLGPLDQFTFGEAAIAYSALFPTGSSCRTFGSAYVKSRASDSFTSELKDFIAPTPVQITNCTSLITTASTNVEISDPISDTATLGGASADAGGTLTFSLFSEAGCPADSEVDTGLDPVQVDGPGDYNSGDVTPTSVGTYYWTVEYSGDPNNEGASTACGDPNETSVVMKSASQVSTAQSFFPQDTVSVTGGSEVPTGDVTFSLYDNATCTGTPIYSETTPLSNGTAGTNNTTDRVSASGTYRWVVQYPGDDTHEAATSPCGKEISTLTVNDNATP